MSSRSVRWSPGARGEVPRCSAPAVLDIRRHNAAFCRECFVRHCREQVRRESTSTTCSGRTTGILVVVLGWKVLAAVWELLVDLGFRLPTGSTSGSASASTPKSHAVAPWCSPINVAWHCREVDLPGEFGFDIPNGAPWRGARRAVPAACRSVTCSIHRLSTAGTTWWSPVTTSTMRPRCCSGTYCAGTPTYLSREYPVLPASDGFVRK